MGFINQQTSQRGPHWAPLGAARWGLGDVSPEVVLSLLGKAKTWLIGLKSGLNMCVCVCHEFVWTCLNIWYPKFERIIIPPIQGLSPLSDTPESSNCCWSFPTIIYNYPMMFYISPVCHHVSSLSPHVSTSTTSYLPGMGSQVAIEIYVYELLVILRFRKNNKKNIRLHYISGWWFGILFFSSICWE